MILVQLKSFLAGSLYPSRCSGSPATVPFSCGVGSEAEAQPNAVAITHKVRLRRDMAISNNQPQSPLASSYMADAAWPVAVNWREEFLICIGANQHGTLTTEPLALL